MEKTSKNHGIVYDIYIYISTGFTLGFYPINSYPISCSYCVMIQLCFFDSVIGQVGVFCNFDVVLKRDLAGRGWL